MIIDRFSYPRRPNQAQQVAINTKDIAELKEIIKPYYKCTQTLATTDELVARALTNVPEDVQSGFIVDRGGKLFNIVALTDTDNLVIDYWAQLTIGG